MKAITVWYDTHLIGFDTVIKNSAYVVQMCTTSNAEIGYHVTEALRKTISDMKRSVTPGMPYMEMIQSGNTIEIRTIDAAGKETIIEHGTLSLRTDANALHKFLVSVFDYLIEGD
jgi:hypothetical protein